MQPRPSTGRRPTSPSPRRTRSSPPSLAHAFVHGETDFVRQPGPGQELLDGRGPHGVDAPEFLDQAGLAGRSEAWDVVEDALGHPLAPPLAVERDGEAVRLVAHPL